MQNIPQWGILQTCTQSSNPTYSKPRKLDIGVMKNSSSLPLGLLAMQRLVRLYPARTPNMSKKNRIEDADRDLAAELLAAAKEIKSGHGKVVPTSEIVAARVNLNMSQAQFSALLGVSVRTLQKWEQNERQPSAAAQKLITIALKRPEVLIELFAA